MLMKMILPMMPTTGEDEHGPVAPPHKEVAPYGSLPKEVADDVPAMLSEGEYVVPADVVRYWGVKHLEEMHSAAKYGLMAMKRDNRMHMSTDGPPEDMPTSEVAEPGTDMLCNEGGEGTAALTNILESKENDAEMEDLGMEKEDSPDDQMEDLGLEAHRLGERDMNFDGKATDKDGKHPLYMAHGGDVGSHGSDISGYMNVGNAYSFEPSPEAVAAVAANKGKSAADIASDMVDAAKEKADAAATGLAAGTSVSELSRGDFSGVAGTVARGMAAIASRGSPVGIGSMLGLGPSINSAEVGFTINGVSVPMNMGVGVQSLAASISVAALSEIATKAAQNDPTVSLNDISMINGSVVGVQRGNVAGMVTASVVGNVAPDFSVESYNAAQSLAAGTVPGTAPRDPATGIPDFGLGVGMIGVSTDPSTGSKAGYSPVTGLSHGAFGTAALGTALGAAALSKDQRDQVATMRGYGFDEEAIAAAVSQQTAQEEALSASIANAAAIADDFGATTAQKDAHDAAVSQGNAPVGSSPNSAGGYSTKGGMGFSTDHRGDVMSRDRHNNMMTDTTTTNTVSTEPTAPTDEDIYSMMMDDGTTAPGAPAGGSAPVGAVSGPHGLGPSVGLSTDTTPLGLMDEEKEDKVSQDLQDLSDENDRDRAAAEARDVADMEAETYSQTVGMDMASALGMGNDPEGQGADGAAADAAAAAASSEAAGMDGHDFARGGLMAWKIGPQKGEGRRY